MEPRQAGRVNVAVFIGVLACGSPSKPASTRAPTAAVAEHRAPVAADRCSGELTFDSPRLERAVRESIRLPDAPLTAADVGALKTLWNKDMPLERLGGIECLAALESLRFQSENAVDLAPLAALSHLRSLHIDEAVVDDAGPLGSLRRLKRLRLRVTDATTLAGLERLEQLETLILHIAGPADLAPLSALKALWRLDLTITGETDLAPLAALNSVRRLKVVAHAPVELTAISTMHALRRLSISSRGEVVLEIPRLSGLSRLRRVTLALGQSAVALAPLDGLVALEQVVLDLPRVETLELGFVTRSPRLESLWIKSPRAPDFEPLKRVKPETRFTHVRAGVE